MKLLKIDKDGIWYEAYAGDHCKITHKLTIKVDPSKLKSSEVLYDVIPDEVVTELTERGVLEIQRFEKLR